MSPFMNHHEKIWNPHYYTRNSDEKRKEGGVTHERISRASKVNHRMSTAMADRIDAGLCEYELQRLRNIRTNEAMLAELGLTTAASSISWPPRVHPTASETHRPRRKRVVWKRDQKRVSSLRRRDGASDSTRKLRSESRVNADQPMKLPLKRNPRISLCETPQQRVKTKKKRCGTGKRGGWNAGTAYGYADVKTRCGSKVRIAIRKRVDSDRFYGYISRCQQITFAASTQFPCRVNGVEVLAFDIDA